jgi:hypothetical protein
MLREKVPRAAMRWAAPSRAATKGLSRTRKETTGGCRQHGETGCERREREHAEELDLVLQHHAELLVCAAARLGHQLDRIR